MALQSRITVLVISSSKTYYNGEAYAVSSRNSVGPFSILEGHSPFITLIANDIVVEQNNKKTVTIPVTRGVLTVKENAVRVYVGL